MSCSLKSCFLICSLYKKLHRDLCQEKEKFIKGVDILKRKRKTKPNSKSFGRGWSKANKTSKYIVNTFPLLLFWPHLITFLKKSQNGFFFLPFLRITWWICLRGKCKPLAKALSITASSKICITSCIQQVIPSFSLSVFSVNKVAREHNEELHLDLICLHRQFKIWPFLCCSCFSSVFFRHYLDVSY